MLEKLTMEFLGTLFGVYFTGMGLMQLATKQIDLLTFSIMCFAVYSTLAWIGKNVSLAQFNPAVSLSLVTTHHLKLGYALSFVAAQTLACFFGISLLLVSASDNDLDLTREHFLIGFPRSESRSLVQLGLAEFIGAFLLVFVYYILVLEKSAPKYVYGAGVGACWFCLAYWLYPKTGCGLNISRMLAYAVLSDNYTNLYVYAIANIAGSWLGATIGNLMLTEKAESLRSDRKPPKRIREAPERQELIE